MEKYRLLAHTADGKFQAFGKTIDEAFANAALALASLMWDWEKIEKRVNFPVQVEGNDLEQLLYKFLEEIIFLLDTKNFLLGSVESLKIERKEERYSLRAFFLGDNHPELYEIYGDVKAITYNEMKIEKSDHFTVQVVVDM